MRPIQTNTVKSMFAPSRGEYHYVFPTPFFRGKVNLNHDDVSMYSRHAVSLAREENPDNPEMNYTTYFSHELREDMHQQPWFHSFANQMKDSYIDFICTQFGFSPNNISRHDIHFFAWISVYNKPHQHEIHNHVKSRISGTYYPFANDESMPIKFLNPSITTMFSHGQHDDAMDKDDMPQTVFTGANGCQSEMRFFPKTGDVLMWPSYMLHCVPRTENVSPEYERIAISFNLNHKEDLGSYHHGDDMDYSFLKYKESHE